MSMDWISFGVMIVIIIFLLLLARAEVRKK
jgi:hypothetical protein